MAKKAQSAKKSAPKASAKPAKKGSGSVTPAKGKKAPAPAVAKKSAAAPTAAATPVKKGKPAPAAPAPAPAANGKQKPLKAVPAPAKTAPAAAVKTPVTKEAAKAVGKTAGKPTLLRSVPSAPAPVQEDLEMAADLGSVPEVVEESPDKVAEKKVKRRDEVKIDRTGNLEQQWKTLLDKSKGVKPVPYKMSENYEARTALQHKVLGWGYVLTSQNNRLEVLFEEGIKILIANYKSS